MIHLPWRICQNTSATYATLKFSHDPCSQYISGGVQLSILFQGTGYLLCTTSQKKTVQIPSMDPQWSALIPSLWKYPTPSSLSWCVGIKLTLGLINQLNRKETSLELVLAAGCMPTPQFPASHPRRHEFGRILRQTYAVPIGDIETIRPDVPDALLETRRVIQDRAAPHLQGFPLACGRSKCACVKGGAPEVSVEAPIVIHILRHHMDSKIVICRLTVHRDGAIRHLVEDVDGVFTVDRPCTTG